MKYPQNLLPQPIFKEITENLSDYFVCRKVPGAPDRRLRFAGIPAEKLIGMDSESDCFDYSTNLPGVFELWHNKIELTGDNKRYYRAYWDWKAPVSSPLFNEDFIINEHIDFFFLKIGDIQKISIPFNKIANKELNDSLNAAVVHTPTNCNFWHFSIKWKDTNGEFVSANKAAWKYNRISTMRILLSQLISFVPVRQEIKEEWFVAR